MVNVSQQAGEYPMQNTKSPWIGLKNGMAIEKV
jgi:hypothetical protein